MTDIIPSGPMIMEGDLWFSGATLAQMAANLHADIYLLIEKGQLDALAVEALGADLMEIGHLLLVQDLQQIDIRCAYANINASSGQIHIEHLHISL